MRIGVLGGTYNPVHYGHLILAENVKESMFLNKVILIPTFISPFKIDMHTASAEDRLKMLELAIEGNNKIEVSDLELKAEGISYTINTMRQLKSSLNDEDELFFICGADAFEDIESWHEHESLLSEFHFIVGMRPGCNADLINETARLLTAKYRTDIYLTSIPQVDISSTQIREKISSGKSIRYLLPESVEKYIYDNKLYI